MYDKGSLRPGLKMGVSVDVSKALSLRSERTSLIPCFMILDPDKTPAPAAMGRPKFIATGGPDQKPRPNQREEGECLSGHSFVTNQL